VWLSVFLVLTLYSDLSSIIVSNYNDANNLRGSIIRESSLKNHWNTVAFFVAQGTVTALALGLTAKARLQQYVFLIISAFCTVATFLPMSRSGVIILAISTTVILFTHRIMRARVIRGAVILIIVTLLFVPQAVLSRLTIITETSNTMGTYTDTRVETFSAVIEHLPEYVLIGVGISPLYDEASGIPQAGNLAETHNIFAQITVYWGLLGLLALLTLVWQAYQCLPRRSKAEPLSLCLRGIGASLFVYSFFVHNLENKEFSIALGLLAGASRWIWPKTLTSQDTTQPAMRYTGTVADDRTASGRDS
jgi:hypothetical protein